MKERFDEKQIYNRYLLDWDYYHKLFYPKILSGDASIFVIYDGERPITLTLNFHREDLVYSFIQIFDVAYASYSMGDIAMYKNLEWCYQQGITLWDTSKGATENKIRWCNYIYSFEHHIFYDPGTLGNKIRLQLRLALLGFNQWLRKKGVIGGFFQLDRIYYFTKAGKLRKHEWKSN